MKELISVLAQLGLSEAEQAIYLSLLTEGQSTARMLALRTGITRTSVYDHVRILKERDLIAELDIDGKTHFAITDVRRLDSALEGRIAELTEGRKLFKESLPSLLVSKRTVEPKIRFFEGKKGVTELMKDILWHDLVTLEILWPYEEMLEVFGSEFLTWFNERRAVRRIAIKSIWPEALKRTKHSLFADDSTDVERRFAPKGNIGKMGYILYHDKTIFVSSAAEGFGFIVESKEFGDMMRMQFSTLWHSLKS